MVLPGLAGGWLDRRWGIQWLSLAGMALGIAASMTYLILMTRRESVDRGTPRRESGTTLNMDRSGPD